MNVLYDLLKSRAESSSTDLALANSRSQLTFGELLTAVDSSAAKLASMGIGPRLLIRIDLPDFENWILTLAIAKLGAISLSMPEGSDRTGLYHLRISTTGQQTEKELYFEPNWFGFSSAEGLSQFDFSNEDFIRGITTSGTTGKPKIALFNHFSIVNRTKYLTSIWSAGAREFNLMPLAATGGFSTAITSLLTGSPYLTRDTRGKPLVDFLSRMGITELTGSPDQVAGFMTRNKEHLAKLPSVKLVRLAGSAPSASLLSGIKSAFDAEVISVYGSTEAGAVFSNPEVSQAGEINSLGTLRAGCSAQVVDESGNEVPDGSSGYLRVRTTAMFSGYLKDLDTMKTEGSLEWFESGDMVTKSIGGYRFLGRPSDILNVGGRKISVSEMEQYATNSTAIQDALCFVGQDESGRDMLVMAVVSDNDNSIGELMSSINSRFADLAPALFWKTEEIPRAGLDKPARWLMAEKFRNEY